ncbi:glycosyl hydrolase [Cohnella fermenti]|uniref:Glycosyl hydrolase n=2 Tax=Cohnella fermenti TaxID=2565925 RepID=A0A4S4BWN2_9BACL|nr:glycosyl hydrolase [Cohnella fermenti]
MSLVLPVSPLSPLSPWTPSAAAAGVSASASAAAASQAIKIELDHYALPFDSAPRIDNGVTLVPFRTIAEALGITVSWDAAAKTVVAVGKDADGATAKVVLTLGKKTAVVNGQEVALTAAPVQQQGRVLIPMAFFGRQFGATVEWDGASKTVKIQSPKREMRLMGYYAISSYDQVSRIDSLNAVAFGWSQIDTYGAFTTTEKPYRLPFADGDVTPESIVQRAEDSYLMVFGVDGQRQLTKTLTDAAAKEASIEQMVAFAQEKGIGGIMLDYEGLGWKDDSATAQKQFNGYVSALSERLKQEGLKLSLVLQPLNGSYKGYDYKTLAGYADEIVIMAYAYGEEKQPEPLAKVDEAIRLALAQDVAKEKLMLAVNMDNENETTVGDKIGLAKRYSLAGVAFWRLGILTQAELSAIDASVTKIGG